MQRFFIYVIFSFFTTSLLADTIFDYNQMQYFDEFEVPVLVADETNTKGYGNFVYDYDKEDIEIVRWPYSGKREINCGVGGGITEGLFKVFWKSDLCFATNEAVGGHYVPCKRIGDTIYTHEANYHPDSAQLFFPLEKKPFILFLSKKKSDDVTPKDFVAFVFDGSCGFKVDPGVWHQPPFSGKDGIVFQDKQGAVHACIAVHFPKEFQVLCKMTDALKIAESLKK